jgi:Tol biopolymer transport system component
MRRRGAIRGRGRRAALAVALASAAVPAVALAGVGGATELVSVGPGGTDPVTARDFGAVSADGRFVAFATAGRDIDPADGNPYKDVYVKDRSTGAFDLVSAGTGGPASADSTIGRGGLSADGNVVAFSSSASNLGPHDVNGLSDVFVRDRAAAATTMASLSATGLEANGASFDAVVSDDGRFVAFTSKATNLVATAGLPLAPTARTHVYVRDRQGGTTSIVSANPAGLAGNGDASAPAISGDGTKVAFVSGATDLVAGDTNGKTDVFVRDLVAGTTTRASVSASGAQANGDSREPFVDGTGAIVGFTSTATNLGGLKYHKFGDVFLRHAAAGRTEHVMPDIGLEPNNASGFGAITADGRFVSFASAATNYVPGDTGQVDVFVFDRATGKVVNATTAPDGRAANNASLYSELADDGASIAFASSATNLVAGRSSFGSQVFRRPLTVEAVAPDQDGDGVPNLGDNCPATANPDQGDVDQDGRGDACDLDVDSDSMVNSLEPAQSSDPAKFDTDGDGVNDYTDDFPADATRQTGVEHQALNVARLEGDEGRAVARLEYDAAAKKFNVSVAGQLWPNQNYTVVVFRRAAGIREARACAGRASASGQLNCGAQVALPYFTHVQLRRGATVIATAVPERPLAG